MEEVPGEEAARVVVRMAAAATVAAELEVAVMEAAATEGANAEAALAAAEWAAGSPAAEATGAAATVGAAMVVEETEEAAPAEGRTVACPEAAEGWAVEMDRPKPGWMSQQTGSCGRCLQASK